MAMAAATPLIVKSITAAQTQQQGTRNSAAGEPDQRLIIAE